MASGADEGTRSTANWLPFLVSKSVSVCSSADVCCEVSVPVWSTTCPVNAGTGVCAMEGKAQLKEPASKLASSSALPHLPTGLIAIT